MQTPNPATGQYRWKVVDENGKNIAIRIDTEAQAQEYIAAHQQAKAAGTYTTPTTGGGTLTTNPGTPGTGGGTGTGTGGTGGTPASTYTVPADVLNANPAPGDSDEAWAGADTSDPTGWKVARMVTPNPATGEYRWKVVDENGKNIAIRFNSEAEAQDYIAKHQLAKQRGGYTSPTTGGGTLNIPVLLVVVAEGTGGGTGGTGGTSCRRNTNIRRF